MYCLSELKDLFLQCGYRIKEYNGHTLVVGKNEYWMVLGQYYKNSDPIEKKKLIAEITAGRKKKSLLHKISEV